MIFWMLAIVTGSMPVNGSSKRMILGLETSAAGDLQPPPLAAGKRQGQRLAEPGDVELLHQLLAAAGRVLRSTPSISITPSRFFSTVSLRKTLDSWAR